MISCAIIENEEKDANLLKKHIQQYCEETGEHVETAVFSSGVLFLRSYAPGYDLIFMDIEMPGLNGIETARELRERDESVQLIFTTNMAQYAIQGYSVGAIDYVLKPVRYPDFKMRMERVRKMLLVNTDEIVVPYQGGVKLVNPKELIYVESLSHQITFHMVGGTFATHKSTREWEAELSGKGFIRCNTSYLVNLRYCKEVDGNTLKIGEEELQISRARKKDLIKAMMHTM